MSVLLEIDASLDVVVKERRRHAGGLLQRETNFQTLITLIQLSSANIHSSLRAIFDSSSIKDGVHVGDAVASWLIVHLVGLAPFLPQSQAGFAGLTKALMYLCSPEDVTLPD